jgi:hypothetical protein
MTPDAIDTIYQRLKRSTIIQTIAPDDEMWLAARRRLAVAVGSSSGIIDK